MAWKKIHFAIFYDVAMTFEPNPRLFASMRLGFINCTTKHRWYHYLMCIDMERTNAIIYQSKSEAMVDGPHHMIHVALIISFGRAVYPVGWRIRMILLNWTSNRGKYSNILNMVGTQESNVDSIYLMPEMKLIAYKSMSIKPAHNSIAPTTKLMMYRVDLDQVTCFHAPLDDTLPPMKIINPKVRFNQQHFTSNSSTEETTWRVLSKYCKTINITLLLYIIICIHNICTFNF